MRKKGFKMHFSDFTSFFGKKWGQKQRFPIDLRK